MQRVRPPPQIAGDQDEDYEFSGIEKQSQIVQKLSPRKATEKKNRHEKSQPYQLRKGPHLPTDDTQLLKKELPKAEVKVNFTQSFKETEGKTSICGCPIISICVSA